MHLPEQIYCWLVATKIINNDGQIDEHRNVQLSTHVSNNLDNGFIIGEVIRRIITLTKGKIPSALLNVKSQNSKNTKLTNWNFIWLTFDTIGIKLDNRIKQLILAGQTALIIQVLRQLNQLQPQKLQPYHFTVKQKTTSSPKKVGSQAVDVKKINLNKDPSESESSLQFLILLLKASLGMTLEQILGLFTNQNKLLSQIIVKGINENYGSIILFYSLLSKHAEKLKNFHQVDSRDAQACLFAIKTGFISKSPKVAELTVQVFSKLNNIYEWFINQESKCSGAFLLGIKRHPNLRQKFWQQLLIIIKGHQLQYFTSYYTKSFLDSSQHIQVSAHLLNLISDSFLGDLLLTKGVIYSWLLIASHLPQESIPAQQIVIYFIGQILLYFPSLMQQNQQLFVLLNRNWQKYTLCQFVTLTNQLMAVLQKLADAKSSMARRVYEIVANIAKRVGAGDKHDYLIENSILLLRKFSSIPSQHLLKSTDSSCLTNSEYLLACETIQLSEDLNTLIVVGFKIKGLFIQNPLLNFYLTNMLKEISLKLLNTENGFKFIQSLIDDSLNHYSTLFLKYKSKPKPQNALYFGKSGSPSKVSKPQQEQIMLNQKRKQLYLKVVKSLTDLAFTQQSQQLKSIIKQKLLNCNSKIRFNNFKIADKEIQEILQSRFEVQKDEQVQHLEQFKSKAENNMSESMVNRSKASQLSVSLKLKGPEHLTKEFQSIVEKRKAQEEQRQVYQIKKQLWQQKRKISVRKQLQIANLLRGQIGEAQLRDQGFFNRLIQDSKEYDLVFFDQLQQTELEAIDSLLKRYHRVLRHVFLTYSATMYSSHTIEIIEDNIKRKQTLTAVELAKFLKDYGFFTQTSQPQISSIVRDINVKIMNRREVNQLDFSGFQQFIIQFCFNNRAKSSLIHRNNNNNPTSFNSNFPVYSSMKNFFRDLKGAFVELGQKVAIFEDLEDISLSKQQAYTISILNQKVLQNQNYILPAGYKKVAEKTVKFNNTLSESLEGIDQSYCVAYQTLDQIIAGLLNVHIVEPASNKITTYKVRPMLPRPSDQILQRQRASSTTIIKKTPSLAEPLVKRSHSKNVLESLKNLTKSSNQAEQPTNKVEELKVKQKQKQIDHQKAIQRQNRNAELIKAKLQLAQKKQKDTEKEKQARKEKSEERKKREQTQKFLQEQATKQRMKFQQEREQQRIKSQKLAQERQQQLKENKEKFKVIHQAQIQKIKKIELEASQRLKRQEEQEAEAHEKMEEQRKKLRQQIEEQDKNIIQTRKQIQTQLSQLFQSQAITAIFKTYEPNLQALFQFLINRTHISLTEKKLNNQITYESWKYFLNAFEISPLILNPKEAVSIFKALTKDKIVPKEYHLGLNYNQFQQALLRIAVKHKTIFNIINSKIIDQIKPTPQSQPQPQKKNATNNKASKQTTKKATKAQSKTQVQPPQTIPPKQTDIKQILKADSSDKDQINEYGDISKASDKTLRGIIYYLRVPSNKIGQQARFRQILAQKHSVAMQNSDKLKQKLQGVYSLQTAVKPKQKVGKGVTQEGKPN